MMRRPERSWYRRVRRMLGGGTRSRAAADVPAQRAVSFRKATTARCVLMETQRWRDSLNQDMKEHAMTWSLFAVEAGTMRVTSR